MQLAVQLAGQQHPLLVDVPLWCETLQDVADLVKTQLEEGTWIDVDNDDVEVGASAAWVWVWVLAERGCGCGWGDWHLLRAAGVDAVGWEGEHVLLASPGSWMVWQGCFVESPPQFACGFAGGDAVLHHREYNCRALPPPVHYG